MMVSGDGVWKVGRERSSRSLRKAPESLKDSKGNISEENKILLEPPIRHGEHESLPPVNLSLSICLFVPSQPSTTLQ